MEDYGLLTSTLLNLAQGLDERTRLNLKAIRDIADGNINEDTNNTKDNKDYEQFLGLVQSSNHLLQDKSAVLSELAIFRNPGVKEFFAQHQKMSTALEAYIGKKLDLNKTFADILKHGPKTQQEYELVQATYRYLKPGEIRELSNSKLKVSEVAERVQKAELKKELDLALQFYEQIERQLRGQQARIGADYGLLKPDATPGIIGGGRGPEYKR